MKTLIIFTASTLITCSALAQGNIIAPVVRRNTLPPINTTAQSEGGLQRGFRLGNPLQMLNPFAPRRYGDGAEFLTPRGEDQGLRPRDRSRSYPIGLRLISIPF